jgi:hypothetical protein
MEYGFISDLLLNCFIVPYLTENRCIYRLRLPSPTGVLYLRFRPHTPEEPAILLLNLLQTKGLQFGGQFTVIERDQIRQRPLP